ncbi:hypothetical protein [Granulicella arctica]|uniref:hypothetical protein n=1 Tax=Granulicella arctica TaxID=940613 RepID=UPI0021DFD80E|nr:hypothetical protein [Granulicella arctica]
MLEPLSPSPQVIEIEAEEQAKVEWLHSATDESFAAFDRGEGVSPSSAGEIDTFVNDAIEEGRAPRRTTRA